MIDRDFLAQYLRFLDTASLEELETRHKLVLESIPLLHDPGNRRDAKYLLRLLEAEIFVRRTMLLLRHR